MNRRGFLAVIAGGLVLDPERLLWRPGKKLISIPKPRPTTGGLFNPHADIAGLYMPVSRIMLDEFRAMYPDWVKVDLKVRIAS